MVSTAASILGLSAVVLAFWFPLGAWIPYAIPAVYLLLYIWSMRQRKAKSIAGLSPPANALLARYPYWYEFPNVAKDCSRAAGFLGLLALVLAGIGYTRDSAWSLTIGAVAFGAMSVTSRGFDPISRLSDEASQKAQEEIVAHLIDAGRRDPGRFLGL